ncbi:MAG TPA: ATP-binding protein [Prolixibacteraceae bacterium]|nr:ATP-binding protein [Prolixibacteraceae bacterium]HPR60445.1 ATP-binding protein [Prolixibacteraceae bacterium]
MKIISSPLFEMIAQGEHQQQDFKYCINDSRKIARSLVAFANTDGGRLLVGVKDNGKIAGVRSEEEYYMVEAAANIYSKPKIPFDVQQWDAEGKTVLEIIIKPSSNKPHYAQNDEKKWLAYIRLNDENILANKVILKSWELSKNPKGILFAYDEPRKNLIDYLNNNQSISLSKFSRIAKIERFYAEQILAEMLSLKCIETDLNSNPIQYRLNENFNFEQFPI